MSEGRAVLFVALAALGLRLAYTLGVYLALGPDGLLIEDSGMYVSLALSFIEHGDFVAMVGGGAVLPVTERMPLYVIFLVAHFFIQGSAHPLFPALTQAALDALTCVLVARLAARFDPRLLLPAGLIAALNPTQIVVGATLLTDSIFLLICTVGLTAALDWMRRPSWRSAILLGAALALGISARAMLVPWLVAVIVLLPLGALWLRTLRPAALAHLVLAGVIAVACQAPILARNISEYGTAQLTSQTGTHAMGWVVPLVREAKDGTSQAEGARELDRAYRARYGDAEPDNPFESSRRRTDFAYEAWAELGLGATAKAWLMGAAINLFSPGVILATPISKLPRTGFFDTPGESKLDKVRSFLFANDNAAYAWALLLGTLGVILARAAQAAGLAVGFAKGGPGARERRVMLVFLLIWAAYILAVNGPIASPKYRLPIEPVAALLFALALVSCFAWLRKRAAGRARTPARAR
ncbi:MAG: hypothetical protein AB7P52_08840 [Alphaproteobacteria bacterium]